MDRVLHGSATTRAAVRRAILLRKESVRALTTRRGINPKTVANPPLLAINRVDNTNNGGTLILGNINNIGAYTRQRNGVRLLGI